MPKLGVFENVIVAKKFFLEVVELAPVTPKHVLEIRKKIFSARNFTILSYFFRNSSINTRPQATPRTANILEVGFGMVIPTTNSLQLILIHNKCCLTKSIFACCIVNSCAHIFTLMTNIQNQLITSKTRVNNKLVTKMSATVKIVLLQLLVVTYKSAFFFAEFFNHLTWVKQNRFAYRILT